MISQQTNHNIMSEPQTFVYSTVNECEIHLDLYLPAAPTSQEAPLPVVLFFHGGGVFRGSRKSILPELKGIPPLSISIFPSRSNKHPDAALSKDWAFISADYRLLLPSTGFDILTDIAALFSFLATLPTIDTARIMVAGHSGGAYVARQAAIHGTPRPRTFFSVSGQGGHLLSSAYFTPKPYLQKKLLGTYKKYSTRSSAEFLRLKECSEFAWEWRERRGKRTAGEVPVVGERAWLAGMAAVMGTKLDFLTGREGFSGVLRKAWGADSGADLEALVPRDLKVLFPELMIGKEFPPSFVLHGTGDKNVGIGESEKTVKELERVGVECVFVAAENWGHGWSAEVWGRWGKDVVPFFERCIADKTEA